MVGGGGGAGRRVEAGGRRNHMRMEQLAKLKIEFLRKLCTITEPPGSLGKRT